MENLGFLFKCTQKNRENTGDTGMVLLIAWLIVLLFCLWQKHWTMFIVSSHHDDHVDGDDDDDHLREEEAKKRA